MKILAICQYYYPEPFRIHEVCEELAARGHEVTVLTGLPNYPMGVIPKEYLDKKKWDETVNGVRIIRVKETPRKEGKIGLALNYVSFVWHACLKVFTLDKYDVTFVYQLSPILMAIPAYVARWIGKSKRIALYCLDLWPESLTGMGIGRDSIFFKAIKGVSRKIYKGVNALGYSSGMFAKYFSEVLKVDKKDGMHIPQFADELFDNIKDDNHQGINYVFAGNIGKMQKLDVVIRAAAKIDDARIKWHIVGDGFAYEECLQLAEELSVTDRMAFYGRLPVEEMPKFYEMADAMIVTLADNETISYTLPGKVQSYMAAGKAILACANGEVKKVILEAECGMCAPAENVDAFSQMALAMADADTKEYGRKARDYYSKYFNKKSHVDGIEKLIEGAAQR